MTGIPSGDHSAAAARSMCVLLALCLGPAAWCCADVVAFTDPDAYLTEVGDDELISFTEPVVSPGDILFEQYLSVGVVFADGASRDDRPGHSGYYPPGTSRTSP